jgi:hypothetical protein
MNDQTWSSPAVDPDDGNLFIGNNFVAALSLRALFFHNTFGIRPNGQALWSQSLTNAGIAASPMLTKDDQMIVGAFDGFVRAYDKASGTTRWAFGTRDHIYASPAELPDGTVVQPSTDGTVYALNPADGSLVWSFETLEPIHSSPAIDGEGNVYFGGGDGRLYVLGSDGVLKWSLRLIDGDRNDLNASPALGRDAIYIGGENGGVFSVPYDYCVRDVGRGDARCTVGSPAAAEDGAKLVFTSSFGSYDTAPPASIEANQPLAFSLVVRQAGRVQLAHLDSTPNAFSVESDPPIELDAQISGDRRFVTIVPKWPAVWSAGGDGKVRVAIHGQYLVNPMRDGLHFTGGDVGGTIDQTFAFAIPSHAPALAPAIAIPSAPGAPSSVLEVLRLAAPLPTILPTFNQIGFDSLHYLVSMVEGSADHAIGWFAGAKLADDSNTTVIDPDTKVLFPVELSYQNGLLTLINQGGFTVNAMNADIPFDTFRMSSVLAPEASTFTASLYATTPCNAIPTYGYYLGQLGFCNPVTDVLSVFGGSNMKVHDPALVISAESVGDVTFAPDGLRWVDFFTRRVTATVTGSSLKLAEHTFAILLVDSDTGRPVSIPYGLQTARTADADGTITSVTVTVPNAKVPAHARAYLMVDSYPAALGNVDF